MVNSALYRLKY